MSTAHSSRKVAFLVAPEGVEQVELTEPWKAVRDAGLTPVLVSTDSGQVQAFHHLDRADVFPVDITIAGTDPSEYDALVLPGGVVNPDILRWQPGVAQFVQGFFHAGRPVAAICHGPWPLIDADVVRGRRVTSWPSLRTDLRNAGAEWVDEDVVVDRAGPNTLITSRRPSDLPAFTAALIEELAPARV